MHVSTLSQVRVVRGLSALSVAVALSAALTTAALASPQSDLAEANRNVETALAAAANGDVAGARTAYAAFDADWVRVEDGVRDSDRAAYRAIEAGMLDVKVALRTEPVDLAAVRTALERLRSTNAAFIAGAPGSPGAGQAASGEGRTDTDRLHGLVEQIDASRAAIERGDSATALAAARVFQADWPAIEGTVRAKSSAAYTATENDMAEVQALLSGPSPRLAQADGVLLRMRERLAPMAEAGASYGVFDALIIMLREGLEALLVIGALVAFLKKSNNGDKQRWVWTGAGIGVVLSVLLALVLQQAFTRAGAAIGSELVEGATGLLAAAMLFYVSYWLHSKAHMGAWQRYIQHRSSAAVTGGSTVSLAVIALLAVFREGAETAVFYLGIAPSIALGDLVLGIGLGVALLALCGVALLTLGLRLPLRPFFLASSALVYYLGFKFVGTGLHALQVAGVLPATPAPVPSSEVFGVYPTWETALPQAGLLLLAAAILALSMRQQGRPGSPMPASV